MSRKEDLAGKTVVMVGASSGFGRGAAIALVELGANVVLAARRGEVVEALAAELGERALPVTADVTSYDDMRHLADAAVQRFGSVDVWVNNAGIGAMGFFWDIPIEDHSRVVDITLKGVINGSHVALNLFRGQGHGTLVNIASIDSEVPLALQNTYAASKAGVLSLTRALREELRIAELDDIRVGAVLPWAIDTPWWSHSANYTGHAPRMVAVDGPEIVVEAIIDTCIDAKERAVGPKGKGGRISHMLFPHLTEKVSADLISRETFEKGTPVPATSGALHQPMTGTTGIDGGVRARMEREDEQRRD
ncbi:SDR family NAD(P)-dependent oxidoreductase [Salinibacterium sp. dk2585]|uniref:SDR family NAD(P)-dependent oxidoreductase n=1 Tax=unclassified Salinibacterium TaxID=2632331 RepID=UPI0011C2576F|nr:MULTISPECIES: SDR family NAD(P)-dependent oxidoreductase [unclassified Salinibacterium]QEE62334.1 SDR family NAD(P)-dependent oxidoreductase [Salinibacterium sp. dk2585]TXK53685.1 SDR family NAD(P)-dependent oxidoreductase [Salinibacterium sp. dk5596]